MKFQFRFIATLGAVLTPVCAMNWQSVHVSSEATCPSCTITLAPIATVGEGSTQLGGAPLAITRARDGFFYIVDAVNGVLNAFSAKGTFVRQIGRQGAGPGEYVRPRLVFADPDKRIHLLDNRLGRHTVFGQNGEVIASAPIPSAGVSLFDAALLPNGQVVLNTVLRDPAYAGYALVEVDARGNRLHTFDETVFNQSDSWKLERLISARANAELWSAHPYQYIIDLFAVDRSKKRSVARVADWFKPLAGGQVPSDGVSDVPPTARMVAIWEDAEGLLWTMTHAPSPKWKPGPSQREIGKVGGKLEWAVLNRPRLDTVFEVIDPSSGKLLTSFRIDRIIGYSLGEGYVAAYRESADGAPLVDVWKVQLKRL